MIGSITCSKPLTMPGKWVGCPSHIWPLDLPAGLPLLLTQSIASPNCEDDNLPGILPGVDATTASVGFRLRSGGIVGAARSPAGLATDSPRHANLRPAQLSLPLRLRAA